MKPRNAGRLLSLVALLGSACASPTRPPPIPVFIHDGLGGADGRDETGKPIYKPPSQLKNWWMTDQGSMAKFAAWCYRTDVSEVERILAEMRGPAPAAPNPSPTPEAPNAR